MNRNNLVFGLITIIILAFICLFIPWGTFTGNVDGGLFFNDQSITISPNGINGTISLLNIKLPNWILIVFIIVSSLICILNIYRIISISFIACYIMVLVSLVWILAGIITLISNGSVNIGFILMFICSISSLVLIYKSSKTLRI